MLKAIAEATELKENMRAALFWQNSPFYLEDEEDISN